MRNIIFPLESWTALVILVPFSVVLAVVHWRSKLFPSALNASAAAGVVASSVVIAVLGDISVGGFLAVRALFVSMSSVGNNDLDEQSWHIIVCVHWFANDIVWSLIFSMFACVDVLTNDLLWQVCEPLFSYKVDPSSVVSSAGRLSGLKQYFEITCYSIDHGTYMRR